MKKIVIYFHGYNSSANSDKVQQLKNSGLETHSWDIDINPNVSIPYLDNRIMDVLVNNLNEDIQLYFVGTSLGAWYAAKLAEHFEDSKVILINPSYNPSISLLKYGVAQHICEAYSPLEFKDRHNVYVGTEDNVVDFGGVIFSPAKLYLVEGANHRFREHFNIVIDHIKND